MVQIVQNGKFTSQDSKILMLVPHPIMMEDKQLYL
jgi:hypothetical protein